MTIKKATSLQKERETAEHNNMLKDFLDKDFRMEFYNLVYRNEFKRKYKSYTTKIGKRDICVELSKPTNEIYDHCCEFQLNNIDVSYKYEIVYENIDQAYYLDNNYKVRDVDLDTSCFTEEIKIEIRPIVSEEFTTLLSQMKKINANCLYLREYCGKGMDESKFIELFESQGIKVIFEKQLKLDNK